MVEIPAVQNYSINTVPLQNTLCRPVKSCLDVRVRTRTFHLHADTAASPYTRTRVWGTRTHVTHNMQKSSHLC